MQTGSEFVKLRGPTRHFRRFFSLDADLSHIRWTPTNKKPHKARIAIENIREIRIGKNTEQLRHSEANLGELQEECLFSVIYGDDYETLDLVASCADDANIWVTGLMALTSTKYDCKPTTIAWAHDYGNEEFQEAGSALGGIERGRIHKEEFVELY
ncbi:hypothetical protein OSTOST_18194, partial [Ostertagia ostertagi]